MATLLVLCLFVAIHGGQSYWTTQGPSCRYYCGSHLGSCSCEYGCERIGNCCHDYRDYCYPTTEGPATTTEYPYYTTEAPATTTEYPYYTTEAPATTTEYPYYTTEAPATTTEYPYYTTEAPTSTTEGYRSCRHRCGTNLGSCSCDYSCQYYGNCCYDYHDYCYVATTKPPQTTTTYQPETTTGYRSCQYNCWYDLGSCSCHQSCRYYGNCCHDYHNYCYETTTYPPQTTRTYPPETTQTQTTTGYRSCRYYCGYDLGSCSCQQSCRYYGNCCHDYHNYCSGTAATTYAPASTTGYRSCRYNCGYDLGSCSCQQSCRYYGNCCHDYHRYCSSSTALPQTTTDTATCRYNCGSWHNNCSCHSSCERKGTCCRDYHDYCYNTGGTTSSPGTSCGGSLFGSGSFSSPNYPNYYEDNAYCVWQISTSSDQNLYLTFTYLQLENCCSCDYISVFDGPSIWSPSLGKVCNGSQTSFHSSSNYLTVLFRSDSSLVGRGFNAEYISSLSTGLGRVDCSSDNMNIVVSRSYLNSVGIDSHNVYLNDQYCRPEISYYNVVFNFPLNTCGTVRKFDNGRIVYTNALRAFSSYSGEITRQSLFRLNVSCRMEQDSVSQIMYEVKHHDNVSISGSGRFNTSMSFYTSSNFYYQVTQVPYLVRLNQDLFVEVNLRRGDNNLVVALDTCVASPSPHDFQTRSYDLIRNGCRADSTFYSYSSGTRPYAQFKFKAFQFLRATDHVYLQCKVLICPSSDHASRCRRGCSRRVARELSSEHDTETVVLGPIQLQQEPDTKDEEALQDTKG